VSDEQARDVNARLFDKAGKVRVSDRPASCLSARPPCGPSAP